jgi:DNA primase catalytic subunit
MATARRSDKQNKRYWGLVGRMPNLDDEARRSMTLYVTGHVSTANLSVSEMNGLCEYLEYKLGERRLEDVEFPNRISRAQSSEIARLEKALGWHVNPARLEGFLLRQTGGRTKALPDLTRTEAQKVLHGLKFIALRERQGQPA